MYYKINIRENFYVNFYNDREFIVQDINNWVKTFTNGTIKKIVSDNDIKRSTTQALLNTIYFKSRWLYPFDQNKTIKSKFYVNLDTIQIDMMNKKINMLITILIIFNC